MVDTITLFSQTVPYTNEQCMFLSEHYFETKSLNVAWEWFPNAYPTAPFPTNSTITLLVHEFCRADSVANQLKKCKMFVDRALRPGAEL